MSKTSEGMAGGRVPPHDLSAEESLLGAALLRPTLIGPLAGYVDAGDFYKPAHQIIWNQMLEMYAHGDPIDTVTVNNAISDVSVTSQMLMELQNATPAISNAARYAEIIVEAARLRYLLAHYTTMVEHIYGGYSADRVLDEDAESRASRGIGRRKGADVKGLMTLQDFTVHARTKEVQGEWLLPHIMRPRWRCIVVAGEGTGKGTLMRYLGLHAAAGRDPWLPSSWIMPRRVLHIDAENSDTTIDHQNSLANYDVDFNTECEDRYHIWRREEGLNVRDRRTQAEFEAVLQEVRPDIVFAGPLYKFTRRHRSEDLEQGTLEMLEVLDDFRVRYNFALMLEHHAPKASGGMHRDLNPFGSSALLRWPEFGITLEVDGNPLPDDTNVTLNIGRFRRDREPADWPNQISRGRPGQRHAWIPFWRRGRNVAGLGLGEQLVAEGF